ncbi:MAG TPA: branched-chain amino acid ABC transporter ATP-binding protein/permease [Acidimicrobiales bacterium]|nr:branched-chain amino acid ABC transporter ATP-binding protein/permease [Acidimicrobiales bacterium]
MSAAAVSPRRTERVTGSAASTEAPTVRLSVAGRRLGLVGVLAFVLAFPYLPFVPFSVLGNANVAAQYALVSISLVVLVGWVGQISLGHAGMVGVGAYVTGMAMGGLHVGFPVSLLWGAAGGMAVAVPLGVVALRVRGLYLAVATLIFSWIGQEFLFRQEWFTKHSSIQVSPVGKWDTIPYFPWDDRKVFYYAAWATVVLAIYLMANLRDSKTGRSFFAVRGSEVAAASLGIDVMRTKLAAFAVSGLLAGAAGSLILVGQQTVTPDAFTVERSLFFLAVAVVGGLSSLGGSVAAAFVFAFLNEAFFRVKAFEGYLTVASAALLAIVLLLYRGGLAQVPADLAPRLRRLRVFVDPVLAPVVSWTNRLGDGLARWVGAHANRLRGRLPSGERPTEVVIQSPSALLALLSRLTGGRIKAPRAVVRTEAPLDLGPPKDEEPELASIVSLPMNRQSAEPGSVASVLPFNQVERKPVVMAADRDERRVVLAAEGITVRFGGLVANEDVSLKVCEGEVVGLIGPNGAGKTTLFNAIAGLNEPAAGRIELFGQDVTGLPVHHRALLGVGRTFQAIQLFAQLSVFDNLLVATHQHNPTGMLAHLAVTPASLAAEAEARQTVQRVIRLLDLRDVAHRRVADLPFGVLRMVEVARALVTGAKVIMLDEPASGLDNNETDRLVELIRFIRSLGVSILLIEHDVKMVTNVSDHLYVLDRGRLLAEGPAFLVAQDEAVVAAYLGRAVEHGAAAEAGR